MYRGGPTIIQAEGFSWLVLACHQTLVLGSAEGHRTLSERGIIATEAPPSTENRNFYDIRSRGAVPNPCQPCGKRPGWINL